MKHFSFLRLFTFILCGIAASSDACTGIKLTAKDGNTIHGRTFEFGITVPTSLVVIPRGYSFIASTPKGAGLTYEAKYAAVGTMCYNYLLIMDGMNEMGLSVGTFYFPGFAGYTTTTSENQERSLSPIDFSNWILTQFGTLDEVKVNLPQVSIAPTIIQGWGDSAPPFHYIVYDKSGQSIVIEPINGKLVVYDNPIGVLTNSPTFDWHMTNLRNYVHLSPNNAAPIKLEDIVLSPIGQGSGMMGLPGDFTPPSRFVRAAAFTASAIPVDTANDAVFQAFHLLNQFDIPLGAARQMEKNGYINSDFTLATVVRDPHNMKYYIRTYDDQSIKMVTLSIFDRNAKTVKKVSTAGRQNYVDISKELKPEG